MAAKDYCGAGVPPQNTYYTDGPSKVGVPPQAYGAPTPVSGNRPEMAYAPQNQGFYQNSSSMPYYPPPQPYYTSQYPQQQPLYATDGPGISGAAAGGRMGGERGFIGALLATLCCCCLCDGCCGPAALAGPAAVPVGMVGAPVMDPGCCICC